MSDAVVEGTILRGREFEPVEGRVVVEDGTIAAVEEGDTYSDRVVLPAFVNAHTHVGDSIAKEAGEGRSLAELVARPTGWNTASSGRRGAPDFLVHMVHAERLHLERIEDSETPVVVCPRSNLVTGVGVPSIADLADRTTVALGTDNVFLKRPFGTR